MSPFVVSFRMSCTQIYMAKNISRENYEYHLFLQKKKNFIPAKLTLKLYLSEPLLPQACIFYELAELLGHLIYFRAY